MNVDFSKLGQQLSKSYEQVKQFASEKMGTAEDITSYPAEYRVLEERCDKIKIVYENLIKVNRQYARSDNYESPIQEQMIDVMGKLNEKLNLNANARSGSRTPPLRLIQHAAARAALDGASAIQPPDEITLALEKYGTAEEKMAGYRMEMDQRILGKFVRPLEDIVETVFDRATAARRAAQRSRLDLDSVKSKCKGARPDRQDSLQRELAQAEEQYTMVVEDAISRMKEVVENSIVLQCLSDLVEAQRSYFKQCSEVLNSLIFK